MAFFGKKFKKVDAENIVEFLDALKVSEKVRAILRKTDSLTSFVKNDDGSFQYIVETDGKVVMNQKFTLGEETDFTTPDGTLTKNSFTLDGNVLKSTMTHPDGTKIHFIRHFEDTKFKLELSASNTDQVATVYYQAV